MFLRVLFLALGMVVLADAPLMAQPRRGDRSAAEYGWIFSLEQGKALARASGKPLMVAVRCVP